ncbi:MAG: hypothetical protein P4M11_00900 [Candidatus Pacebacteria bacterium]|nr:hypothetical protein [Candidatus Paceibacterota bacterium]
MYKYYYDHYSSETCPICDTRLGGVPVNHMIADTTKQLLVDTLYPMLREHDDADKKKLYEFMGIKGIDK